MSKTRIRTRARLVSVAAAAVLIASFSVVNVLAVHDEGVFQLDGNAQKSDLTGATAPLTGDDWDNVCAQIAGAATALATCGTTVVTNNAKAVAWVSEPDRSTSIFTGGGSKDPQDLSEWLWKNAGGLPDKDNLRHAFAARYSAGDEFIYFGSDRFDNSGDAQQGFWFLQAPLVADGPSSQGGNTFTDGAGGIPHHVPGDLLVISDFSIGGTVSTINIYSWVASGGDTTTNLDFVDGGTNVKCTPALSGDNFCGIVNPGTTISPWAFLDKSNSTSFLQGELYEAGLNLTGLGFGDECFSSVVSETRSSTSPTATLKDFVVGNFGKCETDLTTTPKKGDGTALTADSNGNNLVEASIGTGTVSVKDSALLDVKGVSTFTGTLAFFICGPIATPTACATGGVPAGSSTVTTNNTYLSDAVTLTSVGRYCWRATFTSGTSGVPDDSDATVESAGSTGECFEVLPVQTTLDTQAVAPTSVDLGQPVRDNATLGGTATQPGTNGGVGGTYLSINATNGAAAGGKITFTLLKANCTDLATGTGTNPQDFTPISGNGTYGPVSFTPNAPGTYHWKAQYFPAAGDPNNLGSTHNAACNDTDETVVVNQVPTGITTRQFVFPQDKATITATGGGNLAGNVTFKLYDSSANCTANGATGLLYSEGPLAISGAAPQSATTNNTSYRQITTTTGIYWRVTYVSTNQAQLGSSSVCVESTAVTYSGNDGTIAIP